jgi:hypothetical protein
MPMSEVKLRGQLSAIKIDCLYFIRHGKESLFLKLPILRNIVITHAPTPNPSPIGFAATGEGKSFEKWGYTGCVAPVYPHFSTTFKMIIIRKMKYLEIGE